MRNITLVVSMAVGVFTASSLPAQLNHGDMNPGDQSAQQPGSPMQAEHLSALPGPVQTALTNYLNIQEALAQDLLLGVRASAVGIMDAIRSDPAQTFSADVARAAEDLARTTDILTARQVFKRLSGTLIRDLDARPEYSGHFVKAYCPMANVKWLQVGSTVNNPYLGKSMARCGRIEG